MRSAILLASVVALSACHVSGHSRDAAEDDGPAGPMVKRTYQLAGFDKVELAGSHDVIVTVGPAFSVSAEGDAKTLDRMEIVVEDGALQVRSKRRKGGWFNSDHGGRHVTVRVTMPSLAAASIEGSGDITVDKVEGASFAGSVAGSGDLDLSAMKVGDTAFSIAGSGGIRARGTSDSAAMSIAGSGDVDAAGLETKKVKVSIAGSGDVRTRAMETADISIMGSGDVTVDGPAKCKTSKMGSGDVHCTNS
jgi:hypothetical protein